MVGYLLGALGALVGGALILRWVLDADPKLLARTLRLTGLLVAGLVVIGLAASRNLGAALVLASLLLPLLSARRLRGLRAKAARGPTPNQSTSIRTAWLDVTLSHDTGEVRGEVRAGRFAGRRFEALALDDLIRLVEECRIADPESQAIVEAHLDRSYGFEWRERAAETDGGGPQRPIDEAEALSILGLKKGASEDEVKAAYHRLMKRHHPDQGGSAAAAARLNAARERLLHNR